MNLNFAINIAIIVLALITGSLVTMFFSKKGNQVFESGQDRDGTILLFLLFATLFYSQFLFKEKVSAEMVANLIGNITGGILTACAFIYKGRQNGNNQN